MIEVIIHFVLVLISFFFGGTPNVEGDTKSYQPTCQDISNAISSKSAVYYDGKRSFVLKLTVLHVCTGSKGYADGTLHWGLTSSQPSACTVEPGSAEDVGNIVSHATIHVERHAHCRYSCKFWANPVFLSALVHVLLTLIPNISCLD